MVTAASPFFVCMQLCTLAPRHTVTGAGFHQPAETSLERVAPPHFNLVQNRTLPCCSCSEHACMLDFPSHRRSKRKYLFGMRVKCFTFVRAVPKVCFVVRMVEFLSIPAQRWSIDRSTKATCARGLRGAQSVFSSNSLFLVFASTFPSRQFDDIFAEEKESNGLQTTV